mmetsp:Transcript_50962/g.163592  ORF Transcript_50962/g.163592 Transcript_50962/m.163592 type:complete len:252 (+) Transcript_50962:1686-2441(+)
MLPARPLQDAPRLERNPPLLQRLQCTGCVERKIRSEESVLHHRANVDQAVHAVVHHSEDVHFLEVFVQGRLLQIVEFKFCPPLHACLEFLLAILHRKLLANLGHQLHQQDFGFAWGRVMPHLLTRCLHLFLLLQQGLHLLGDIEALVCVPFCTFVPIPRPLDVLWPINALAFERLVRALVESDNSSLRVLLSSLLFHCVDLVEQSLVVVIQLRLPIDLRRVHLLPDHEDHGHRVSLALHKRFEPHVGTLVA